MSGEKPLVPLRSSFNEETLLGCDKKLTASQHPHCHRPGLQAPSSFLFVLVTVEPWL